MTRCAHQVRGSAGFGRRVTGRQPKKRKPATASAPGGTHVGDPPGGPLGLWASGLLAVSGSVQHAPRRQASAADDRLSHTPAWHAEGPAHRCQPIQPWPWQRLGQGCGRADTRPRRGGDPRLSRPPPGGAQSGAGQPRFPRGNRGPELAPLLTRAPNRGLCCAAARLLLSPPVRLPARASARLPALLLVCSAIHVPAFQIKHNICTC